MRIYIIFVLPVIFLSGISLVTWAVVAKRNAQRQGGEQHKRGNILLQSGIWCILVSTFYLMDAINIPPLIILICIALTGLVLYLAGLWDIRNRLVHEQPQPGVWSIMPIGMSVTSISVSSLAEVVHIIPRSAGYINEWYVALFGITLLGLLCIFWVLQIIWLNQGNKRRNSR